MHVVWTRLGVWVGVALGLALVAGCSSSSVDRVDQYAANIATTWDYVCDTCPAAISSTSTSTECRALLNPNEAQLDCIRQAERAYPAEIQPYLDCLLAAQATDDACVRSHLSCAVSPPSSSISTCNDAFVANLMTCTLPTGSAGAALGACPHS